MIIYVVTMDTIARNIGNGNVNGQTQAPTILFLVKQTFGGDRSRSKRF